MEKHRNNIEKQRAVCVSFGTLASCKQQLTARSQLFSSQTEQLLQRQISEGVGETAKNQAGIDKAKKERLKSEAKLKQRVQEMHKYASIYRSEMELEFQRCQEEEHRKAST